MHFTLGHLSKEYDTSLTEVASFCDALHVVLFWRLCIFLHVFFLLTPEVVVFPLFVHL